MDRLFVQLNREDPYTQGCDDDLASMITGKSQSTVSQLMQRALNIVQSWWRSCLSILVRSNLCSSPRQKSRQDHGTCSTEQGNTSHWISEVLGSYPGCQVDMEGACETKDQ
jgi:hypothetical protein